MKKFLSVLLSVALIITALPLGAFEFKASAETSGKTGDCTWEVDDYVLTISGCGAMDDYSDSSSPWGTEIFEVIITNGVTNIGDYAFYDCDLLVNITMPNSVISIGDSAFADCSNLTSVTIGDGVTSIGFCSFYACYKLTEVTMGDSVTKIGDGAFYTCFKLTSITIGDSVTSIGDFAFSMCNNLIITVSSDNAYYTSVEGVLFNKNKTTLICYPEGKSDTSYVIPKGTTIVGDHAFTGCSKLNSITIYDSVTSIGVRAFDGCSKLNTVYYIGTEEDKAKITISSNNYWLTEAEWVYDSCIGSTTHTYTNTYDSKCNSCGKWREITDYILGDADGTGEVDLEDVSTLSKYLAGWEVECNEAALDFSGDGVVNLFDLVRLAQHVAGWTPDLPEEPSDSDEWTGDYIIP